MVISKIARKVGSAIVSNPDKSRVAKAGYELGKKYKMTILVKAKRKRNLQLVKSANKAHMRQIVIHNKNLRTNMKLQNILAKERTRLKVLKAKEISRIKILHAHKMMLIRKQKVVDLAKIRGVSALQKQLKRRPKISKKDREMFMTKRRK
jgi:hypothetical protein